MALYMAFKGVFSVCGTSYHIRNKNSYTDVIQRYGRIKDGSTIADRVKRVLIVSGDPRGVRQHSGVFGSFGPFLESFRRSL